MNSIIQTEHLKQRFGNKEAIHDLTLEVPEGSIYAFLGPNGAGKTTTIKTLLNILSPDSGSARVMGVDSTRLGPQELARIGYVSENQQLPEWMTIQQFLDYCRPFYPEWDPAFCSRLLSEFNLPLKTKIKNLSRGMKVKVSLVSSLAYRPRLLVLDEPFSGLDPLVRDEFIRGILEMADQGDWTVFLSSHDIDEVERLADWIGIINEGKLHTSERTESLQGRFRRIEFSRPGDPGILPSDLPASWLNPECAGLTLRVIESRYVPEVTEAEIFRRFPGALNLAVHPMTLREILLTLGRSFRLASSSTPPPVPQILSLPPL